MKKLNQNFFRQETMKVAVGLLGKVLVRHLKGTLLKGVIIETEAYLGLEDPCCHSFNGRFTDRTKVMYCRGGCTYVYFTYGMHYCFNIVTAQKGQPEAVLIRALKPIEGVSIMKQNRKFLNSNLKLKDLTNGPAKLCQALQIDKNLNGVSLSGDQIYIEDRKNIPSDQITTSQRIGLPVSEPASYLPLRFCMKYGCRYLGIFAFFYSPSLLFF